MCFFKNHKVNKSVFAWGNLKFWKILNFKNLKYFNWNSFIFKILCLDKKIKIVRMKENEYKEKRRYTWCASKEKNTNAAWAVAGKSGHDSVYHYTLTTAFSQRRKAWPKPSALACTFVTWWIACSSTCPPTSTPDQYSTSSDGVSWRRGSSAWEKSRKFEN